MTAADDDLGEIRRTGDTVELVFRRRLNRPLEKVWAALTVPERIADWFAQTTINGERIDFYLPDVDVRMAGRIVDNQPMRSFAWTWPQADAADSVVRFELEPDGDGCWLTLTQSGLVAKDGAGNGAGWHAHLGGLEAAADGVRTPWATVIAREQAVNARYRTLAPA